MSNRQRLDTWLHSTAAVDEPVCTICGQPLDWITDLFEADILCRECREQFLVHKKIYQIQGICWCVLYEYNEWLERLLFQYKEQKDIALAPVFLYPYRKKIRKAFRNYDVCVVCSSEQKRLERGFEPVIEILKPQNVYSPLYKTRDRKQSSAKKSERNEIYSVIQRKMVYPFIHQSIVLADDVCTTGATLMASCRLLQPKKVFVLAAHPLWIEEHKGNVVTNQRWIW